MAQAIASLSEDELMIDFFGSRHRPGSSLGRREFLKIGSTATLGLGLDHWMSLKQAKANPTVKGNHFGRAKSCILLYLYGAHPQHETFDPKPDAPFEVQGELKATPTNVPGVFFGEGLPKTAQVMDRVTVVRSMTHQYPLHCFAYAVTAMPTYDTSFEFAPRHPQAWPYVGSVVDFVEAQIEKTSPQIPRNIGLPWISGSKCDHGPLGGPYAAFLGSEYDPLWTDFIGKGTRVVPKLSSGQTKAVYDPWGGCEKTGRFQLSPSCELPETVTLNRLNLRRELLSQFDAIRSKFESNARTLAYSNHQQLAFSLLTSNKLRQAIDIHRESDAVRERYGMTLFGQSTLAARRIIEAGGKFVSVIWDAFDIFAGCAWDTHENHYPRLKEYLLPTLDHALPALLLDLEERGLLDETLVLCLSEHGRTPKIKTNLPGGGRDHWSQVYSILAAGGGIARGRVVGESDSQGAEVKDTPISPKDVLATAYYLLGIDPDTLVFDRISRPLRIAGDGQVRWELLG